MNSARKLHVELPLGEVASFEEMKNYGETLQRFIEMQEERLPLVKDNRRHNEIIDYLELLAETYNEQLRIYRRTEKLRAKAVLVSLFQSANA